MEIDKLMQDLFCQKLKRVIFTKLIYSSSLFFIFFELAIFFRNNKLKKYK